MPEKPMTPGDLFKWGTPVERERRRRIMLCVYAYAYEVMSEPMVSDAVFDALAQQSQPSINTGRFDDWWREVFQPHTGQWIHEHPDLPGVARRHKRFENNSCVDTARMI